ncbi:hypothetical protein EH31_13920 [Erythrobacter longus]|uniref:Uncharacterized protein n=1 Tax=Erythrobacter longus TaxID=1044 RepID=A0A074MU61_ERYLO|nr:hypothetical protein [Erythrobacter longus]KEO89127.1 hypothetical protein EH31_13920 [Erythrobacter longus]
MIRIFSVLAVVSMAIGPLSPNKGEPGRSLTMSLCNGGEITIPLGDDDDKTPRDCQSMACHAVNCREKNKRFSKPNLI